MTSQQAMSWANYMPPKTRLQGTPTPTPDQSAASARPSNPWAGEWSSAPAATPKSKGHAGYGSAAKERTHGPRDADTFLPANRKEINYLETFRSDVERDTKDARDSYAEAVRNGEADAKLMQLQIAYLDVCRKKHYLDHHGIMIYEGTDTKGCWVSHLKLTPGQSRHDFFRANKEVHDPTVWRQIWMDRYERDKSDANTDDTSGTRKAVSFGEFIVVELSEEDTGSTSQQAASANASPAAASPTAPTHSDTAASQDAPAPSDDTSRSAAQARADSAAPPAAVNEGEAQAVAAHPRLPLLGFVIPETTRNPYKPNIDKIKQGPKDAKIRFSVPSRDGFDTCYRRLNPPLAQLPGGAETDRQACPFRIYESHGTNPDPRWTKHVPVNAYDYDERMRLMHSRNLIIKEQLADGNHVQFRCWGTCLSPVAESDDCCIFEPVVSLSKLKVGDIVFCQIEKECNFCAKQGNFYAGATTGVPSAESAQCADESYGALLSFEISTQTGSIVGTALGYNIYGRLVEAACP